MDFFDENTILDFLEGRLSNEHESLFEKELSKNAKLQSEVEASRNAILAVKVGSRNELSEKIKSLSDNNIEHSSTNNQTRKTIKMNTEKKSNSSLMRGIAAGLALLIVGFGVGKFLKGSQAFDPAATFADNYKPSSTFTAGLLTDLAKNNVISRGTNPGDDEKMVMYKGKEITNAEFEQIEKMRRDTLMQGLKMFEKSKWNESKEILFKYTTNYKTPLSDYATALYYLGKTSLNQELYSVAVDNLDEFISIPSADMKMKTEAQWERALCYLKVNESKAKGFFEEMAGNNAHSYQDEAKGILAYFD